MGLADREYYREPSQPGFTLRAPRSMVNTLLIINGVFFFINFLFTGAPGDNRITNLLAVTPDVLLQPWLWWKFLTSGFAHADFQHILFNMFGLWMFGRDIESVYGPKEFLRIYLTAIVLGTLGWTLKEFFFGDVHHSLLGASGAVTTVVLLYCLHFPRRTLLLMMVIPVPAWVVGALIILINLFKLPAISGQESVVAFDVHLIGAAFAICYFRFGWNLSRRTSGKFSLGTMLHGLRRRPKLRVHSPDGQHRELDVEADRVLEKLHRDGEASLTPPERRTLEDYSRRMKQKHR